MTSWDFADLYPLLSEAEAERMVREHGLDPDEARVDLGPDTFTQTAELIGWLGY